MKSGKVKIYIFRLIIGVFSINIYGQRGYISNDSTTTAGIKLIDGGSHLNAKICRQRVGDKIIKYTPNDLDGYGFEDDKTYVSRKIIIKDTFRRVFLEQIIKGKASLYFYRGEGKGRYFIEKESAQLIEIPKKAIDQQETNYKTLLENITSDCGEVNKNINQMRYQRIYLSKYIKAYNQCKSLIIPPFKYGIAVGYGLSGLIPLPSAKIRYLDKFNYKYDGGVTLGLFIDDPISLSNFSLHLEMFYASYGHSYNYWDFNKDIDMIVNTRSLNIPVLLRYTTPMVKIRPFFNLGGIYSYQIKNENVIYEATISKDIIEIKTANETSLISDHELGYSIGGGCQFSIIRNNGLFFELRYNGEFALADQKFFRFGEVQFITGLYFQL